MSADTAFVSFLAAFASPPVELVLFGRLDPVGGVYPHFLPDEILFVPLPHYPTVRDLRGLVRALSRSVRAFREELPRLDAVWLFGPHPLSLLFARLARRRGVPVFLGVRQEFVPYVAGRLPSRRWLWVVPVAHALELAYRRLARTCPTAVVGRVLERTYARGGGRVLATTVSLVRETDLIRVEDALARDWDGAATLELLTVGRIEPEKNPLLLADVLERLRERDPRWRLTVVGDGPLREALAARLRERGLDDSVDLAGYVPAGEELWRRYRASHAFLHVSLTEGVPQVLVEAQAAGLPVVATDVGGVRDALGKSGLLVPQEDADAAVAQLEELRTDAELRARLIRDGLESARAQTLEARVAEISGFFGLRG